MLQEHGVYEGDEFYRWFKELLARRRAFTPLAIWCNSSRKTGLLRHKVQVIASDLTERRLLVLPRDAAALGIDDPDSMDVALAVRMSMAIPIFFEPVRFENPEDRSHPCDRGRRTAIELPGVVVRRGWRAGSAHLRDCGWWRRRPADDAVIGPLLKPREIPKGPLGLVPFSYRLLETMLQAHDRLYIEQAHFARTIAIPTCGISAIDFRLSRQRMPTGCIGPGQRAAMEFLESRWDFEAYCAAYRSGHSHSRRADLAAAMS